MSHADKVVVVVGPTGKQGGAAAKHLAASGWRVRALVRAPQSEKARELAEAGVELAPGDMEDRASLDAAMRGAYGVFSVQPSVGPAGPSAAWEEEVRHGRNVADAAKAAGVEHLIYTSVGGAERNTGIGHFESKWRIEQYIRSLGVPATVIRPNAFMELFTWPDFGVPRGVLSFFGAPQSRLQLIAVDDIGRFVALAFSDPATYVGKAIELAGDSLSGAQLAEAIGRATNRTVSYAQIPGESLRQTPSLERLAVFVNEDGGRADIAALRELHPGLLTFDAWLAQGGKALFQSLTDQPR